MNRSGNYAAVVRTTMVCLLLLAVVLPFENKPLHIDEESYLFIAGEVEDSPLRAYDWWRPWQPVEQTNDSFIYAHPPLFLWWMAMLESVAGRDNLIGLRIANLPFVLLLGLSFLRISTRFTKFPGLVTASFLLSPAVLLVLHQSLMIDLPYVALSMGGVMLLFEWREKHIVVFAWLAGIVLGLAILTKYPAIVLLLLTVVGSRKIFDIRGGFVRSWRTILVATGILGAWEAWTWYAYGYPHLLYVLIHAGEIERTSFLSRLAGNVAQLGWSAFAPPVVSLALFAQTVRGWRVWVASLLAIAMAALVLGSAFVPGVDFSGQVPNALTLRSLLVLAFFLGALCLVSMSLRSRQDRFLVVWAIISLLTVLLAHNFASARYLVLAAAPLHLLLWRRVEESSGKFVSSRMVQYVAVGFGGTISVMVGVADYRLASVYPQIGEDVARKIEGLRSRGEVWFSGKWGFRYQMEKLGFQYLERDSHLSPGDLVVVPSTACPGDVSWISGAVEVDSISYGDAKPSLRTMAREAGIGFYSEAFGLLPYGIASGPLETVEILRVEE